MPRDLTIPASIVLAGALVAVGLYFGLRDNAAAPPPAATNAVPAWSQSPPSTTPASTDAAPAQQPATTPAKADATRKRFEAEVAKAVTELKREWKKSCWDPAVKAHADPATSKYVTNLAFNDQGQLVGAAWSEVRDAPSRPDVAQCLRKQSIKLTVSPPGGPVGLDVPIEFP